MNQKLDYDTIWDSNKSRQLIFKEEGKVLFDQAKLLEPGSLIVEIGSFEGKSSSILASVADANDLQLVCIDPFIKAFNGGHNVVAETEQKFREEILEKFENVTLLKMLSKDAVEHIDREIDFIFIDGDHTYMGVKADLENYMPKLKSGAVVALHDYNNVAFWGVEKAFKEYAPDWEEVISEWNLRAFRKP